MEHCMATVLNEYGIQLSSKTYFLKGLDDFKKERPIAKLMKNPTARVKVKRTIDKKYTPINKEITVWNDLVHVVRLWNLQLVGQRKEWIHASNQSLGWKWTAYGRSCKNPK